MSRAGRGLRSTGGGRGGGSVEQSALGALQTEGAEAEAEAETEAEEEAEEKARRRTE